MNNTFLALATFAATLFTSSPTRAADGTNTAAGELICQPPANSTNAATTLRTARGTIGSVERLDPGLDTVLRRAVAIEKLAEGFDWSEGPVWMKEGYLLFSDVPLNTILKWEERTGLSIFLQPSGYDGSAPRGGEPGSNGLARDKEGRLIICQHGNRRIARREKDGSITALAETFEGKHFNSPNDVVVKSNGDTYFTDPPYGLVMNMSDRSKEIPFQGVYRISARDNKVTLLTKELTRPNGLAFSPDEKTLYIANSDPTNAVWFSFPVNDDGNLGAGKLFLDVTPLARQRKGLPDGLKVDASGNLWATGPGGVLIISPQGKHLGTLLTGEATGNCAWGDDGKTLYITADMYLCRVRTLTKGVGW